MSKKFYVVTFTWTPLRICDQHVLAQSFTDVFEWKWLAKFVCWCNRGLRQYGGAYGTLSTTIKEVPA